MRNSCGTVIIVIKAIITSIYVEIFVNINRIILQFKVLPFQNLRILQFFHAIHDILLLCYPVSPQKNALTYMLFHPLFIFCNLKQGTGKNWH